MGTSAPVRTTNDATWRRRLTAVAGLGVVAAVSLVVAPGVPTATAGPLDTIERATILTSGTRDSNPTEFTEFAGTVFFAANDDGDRELWKLTPTSGNPMSAAQVKDINPGGSASSNPHELTVIGDTLFFAAHDGFNTELFSTDGSASGTRLVRDLSSGADSDPTELTAHGGRLFFNASDGTDRELYVSDGTTAGTVLVKDIYPGPHSGDPQDLTSYRGGVLFSAASFINGTARGRELWRTDGTAAGTVRLSDINPGDGDAAPGDLTVVGDTVFFSAHDPIRGRELWKSDGTAAGTVLVKNINPGTASSFPRELTAVGDTLFFAAQGAPGNVELWKSDGTAAGTVQVKDIRPGGTGSSTSRLAALGDRLMFVAATSAGGELWTSDGTEEGTVLVRDIHPGGRGSIPENLVAVGAHVYFSADEPAGGRELWRSDGTEVGTVRVSDLRPGVEGSEPRELARVGGTLYLSADNGSRGRQPWRVVDTVSPETSIISGPAEGSTVAQLPVSVGFEADEAPVTFECRTRVRADGADDPTPPPFADCSGPGATHVVGPSIPDGAEVTVEVRATDDVGNVEGNPASRSFTFEEPVDEPPSAVDDAATVDERAGAAVIDVLANDTDVDGGPLLVESVSDPAHGTATVVDDGAAVSYEPDPDYCNDPGGTPDEFTYTLNGGSTAPVVVTVTCIDDAPIAVPDEVAVPEDSGATAVDVIANDTDPDGGPLLVASVSDPAHGTATVVDDGAAVSYEPDQNYCNDPVGNPDDFTYTLNGGSTATVVVTVTCVDDAPVAVDDAVTMDEDSTPILVGVLANDTDVDGGPMLVESVSDPAHGSTEIADDGAGLTYAPDADYCNEVSGVPDQFTYTLNGGSSATVNVSVTCLDDPPVAVDDAVTVEENGSPLAIEVLFNDTDVDGGPMLVESVSDPAHGAVEITASGGSVTYTPEADHCTLPEADPEEFTYTLNGGSTATVSVTVTCIAPPDITPPETTITTRHNLLFFSLWLAPSGTIAFASPEADVTFECRLDAAEFQPCTSPADVQVPRGSHVFEVRARDKAGNVDPTPARHAILSLTLS